MQVHRDNQVLLLTHFADAFFAGLNDFLKRLDDRYEEKIKKDATAMARKVRKVGAHSTSPPPIDAPEWTVDTKWKEAKCKLYYQCHTVINC